MRRSFCVLVLLMLGCGPDSTVAVRPKLIWEPAALEFGDRPILDDLSLSVRLLNVGAAPLELSSVRIEGDGAFVLEESPTEIQGGAERELVVRFTALEMKAYEATLVIESDDDDNPQVRIALTGEGTTVAHVVVDPPRLEFGRVGESRSAVRRVKLTSTGTADLKIRNIAFSEATAPGYGFVGSMRTPHVLKAHVDGAADDFVELSIKFAPTAGLPGTDGTLVIETTDPDNSRVEIPLLAGVNHQPVALPGEDRLVAPGDLVELDGSASFDPDGDEPLSFSWVLREKPEDSESALEGADTPTPSFRTDYPGLYALELVVTDAEGLSSVPARVDITGASTERLVVALLWDHSTADLDLHMRPDGAALNGPLDCHGYQPRPDWGVAGPEDDPFHTGDRLSGFGPERIVYENPVDGRYRIAARYVSSQGSGELAVRATVRVYLYGQIHSEITRVLTTPGEVWEVASLAWPSGAVEPTSSGTN